MIPGVQLFLDTFGVNAVSGIYTGKVLVDIASDIYKLSERDYTRTLYTLIASVSQFGNCKEKDIFSIGAIQYKVVKPPIIKNDEIIFVCDKV